MKQGQMVTGTVEGTGSAINVELGFMPAKVELFNEDGLCHMVWTDSMAAGKGMKTVTAGTVSFVASNGVSQYAGATRSASKGFTIGTDTDINVSGETLHYVAHAAD